jgi:hypothetical protein
MHPEDDDLDEDEDYDLEDVDSYSPPKNFRESYNQDALIGKRVQRALAAPDADLAGGEFSSVYDETPQTPYPGESLNNMIARSEIKPFRNVVKRYWTEDEVNLSFA